MLVYTDASMDHNVLTVRFNDVSAGWEQWVLLTGDRHHDNTRCRRDLEIKHLEEAKERQALILDVGDLFCAMQGKYDPRSSLDDLRPEDKVGDYLDSIVRHAAGDYAPYAKNFLLLGKGNHEESIYQRHGVDLLNNLAFALNREGGRVFNGGIGGWVRFMFKVNGTVSRVKLLKYHHGTGGGNAPVTRGVIQTNRQAVVLPDADIVVNGHTHDTYHVPITRERCSKSSGKISRDISHYVRTPTYKDEYGDGSGGWANLKGMPPKPIGCAWLCFYYVNKSDIGVKINLDVC